MAVLKKIWALLSPDEKRSVLLLAPAVVVMGLLQTVAMAALLPFFSLLAGEKTDEPGLLDWFRALGDFQDRNDFLFFVGLLVLGVIAVSNVFSALTTWGLYRFAWRRNHSISTRLLREYLSRPYIYFIETNSSELIKTLLTEVQQVVAGVLVNGLQMLSRILLAAFTLALLLWVDPRLSLIAAVTIGGLYGSLYWAVRRRLALIGRERLEAESGRLRAASEAFAGIKEIKLLALETAFR